MFNKDWSSYTILNAWIILIWDDPKLETLKMINTDNAETSGRVFSIYGEPLGLGDPNIIKDDQITVSSDENHLPRLYHTTWSPGVDLDLDEEHWVKIDFRKFVLIKAIQILSPLRLGCPLYPTISVG